LLGARRLGDTTRRSNMLRRSVVLVFVAVALCVAATPAISAQRTVLAELFGASW
jgi:hypothetical protein